MDGEGVHMSLVYQQQQEHFCNWEKVHPLRPLFVPLQKANTEVHGWMKTQDKISGKRMVTKMNILFFWDSNVSSER